MGRRQMGEGSIIRVLFGRQPEGSPIPDRKGCGCLTAVTALAGITAGLVVAGQQAMGVPW